MLRTIHATPLALGAFLLVLGAACGSGAAPTATTAPKPAATTAPTATRPVATATAAAPAKSEPQGTLAVTSGGAQGMAPLDPHTGIDGNAIRTNGIVFGGLVTRDVKAQITPDIASKWEVSPDGKVYKFAVDKKARWHDGTPVTAKDVKFSIERYTDGRKNIYGREVSLKLERVELVDESNVTVALKSPFPAFFDRLVEYLMIVPKDYVEKMGDDNFRTKPIGAGPFKVVRFEHDSNMEVEAFLDHNRKVPSVKRLTWRYVPEAAVRMSVLKAGEADIIDGLSGPMYDEVKGSTQLRVAVAKYFRVEQLLFFDLFDEKTNTPFRDIRVRQAASLALDRQAIADRVFRGLAEPFGGAVAPYQFGYDPSIAASTEYNPAKAKQLLVDAGYPNGFKTKIYLQRNGDLMEAAASFLAKIGIEAEQVKIEGAAYSSLFTSRKLDGLGGQDFFWAARLHPAASIPVQLRSGMPYAIWSTPEIDAAIDAMESNPQDATRVQLLSRLIAKELPRVPIVASHSAFAIGPRVDAWEPVAGMPSLFRLEYATLKR